MSNTIIDSTENETKVTESAIMVNIRRQWNSWRVAETEIDNLSGIHWSNISGGVGRVAPRDFLHGYVNCDKIVGEIDHSCSHGPGPHRIKVCIIQKDNPKAAIKVLKNMADLGL